MAATTAIPPGGTWFDTLKSSFVNVPIDAAHDNAIATTDFLDAADSLTTLFDLLGSLTFNVVKNDVLGNVKVHFNDIALTTHELTERKKVRDRQLAAPAESENLQSLVVNELKTKKHVAAEGLLWLVRGLDFTAQSLRHNLANPNDELSTSFRAAYTNTLKPHHSFVIKPIFSAAVSATPYKKDFYAKLGDDPRKVTQELEAWLSALEKQMVILKKFQATKEAKW